MNISAISLLDWSGRASGLETQADFKKWVQAPFPIDADPDYKPSCPTVSPRLRGKSSVLSRLAMAPFFELVTRHSLDPAKVDLVFASKFGEIKILASLFESIYGGEPVSPLDFCNSVHHTATGYLSIAALNQGISRTVSAGEHTFSAALVETWALLDAGRSRQVLLLLADEAVPAFFQVNEAFTYGLAMLFVPAASNDAVQISLDGILELCSVPVSPFIWLQNKMTESKK